MKSERNFHPQGIAGLNANRLKAMSTKISLNHGYQPTLVMKAVIIYHEIEFAATASSTLARVGCQPGVNVHWTMKYWPMKALKDVAFAEHALAQALGSHIIVFLAERASTLPSWIFYWLNRWATRRRIHNAALGVIRNGKPAGSADARYSQLLSFAQQHGLSLIADEGPATTKPPRLLAHFPTEEKALIPLTQMSSTGLATQGCLREFGINE